MHSGSNNNLKAIKMKKETETETKTIDTIPITDDIIETLGKAIEISRNFEDLTGKQMNITGIVGEVLACKKHNLRLVVNDINVGYDALDKNRDRVQIKTRRCKGARTTTIGSFNVLFDHAILVLLNERYELEEDYCCSSKSIKDHFERINDNRKKEGKSEKKNMTTEEFKTLAKKEKSMASNK